MRTIQAATSIDIAAPPGRVWRAVTALDEYPRWNPFIVRIEGQAVPGAFLKLHLRWADGRPGLSPEIVTVAAPPADGRPGVFAYRSTLWLTRLGLLRAERFQRVSPLPDGGTRYETVEAFGGPLARFLPLPAVQDGFEQQARALKAWTEAEPERRL